MVCDGIHTPTSISGYYLLFDPSIDRYDVFPCQSGCLDNSTCDVDRAPYDSNFLCAQCTPGRYNWSDYCSTCSNSGALLAVVIILTFIFSFAIHRTSQAASDPSLKIILYFLSTSHLFLIQVSSNTYWWLSWLGFFSVDGGSALGGACLAPLDPSQKIVFQLFFPLILVAEIILFFILELLYSKLRGSVCTFTPYRRSLFSIGVFSTTSISTTVFRALACEQIGPYRLLSTSYDIDCSSDHYHRLFGLFVFVAILVICSPICLFVYLYWNKQEMVDPQSRFALTSGNIYQMYTIKFSWWESIAILRRIALGAMVPIGSVWQGWVLICATVLALQAKFHPFLNPQRNLDEFISLFSLTFICGLCGGGPSLSNQVLVSIIVISTALWLLRPVMEPRLRAMWQSASGRPVVQENAMEQRTKSAGVDTELHTISSLEPSPSQPGFEQRADR